MPRTARASVGGMCYHVLNRGNGRAEVFHKEDDYAAFLKLLCQASKRVPMRLLAYCLMPDHFHLVVWTLEDGDSGALDAVAADLPRPPVSPPLPLKRAPKAAERPRLDIGPVRRTPNWLRLINEPQTEAEVAALRESVTRGSAFGSVDWKHETVERLGLEYSLRPRGRPRKVAEK